MLKSAAYHHRLAALFYKTLSFTMDKKSFIPGLTPRILHEFVEKIVIHAATDPHSKINRRQEVDIYYKGIGILEMSKVFDSRQK